MLVAAEDRRWQAVASRDAAFDASLRYGVTTTGIYCRPSCTTPTPLQNNAVYFADNAAAEAAGFTPCKRCRPQDETSSTPHIEAVRKACMSMHSASRPPAPATLAENVGMSRFHFHRVFKNVLGVTPHEYASELRWKRLSQYLTLGLPTTEAIYEAGFGAVSRVYEKARRGLGMTPAIWRASGAGAAVWYAIIERRFRDVLVAGTDDGVSTIALNYSRNDLEDLLYKQFSAASIRSADDATNFWLSEAVEKAELPDSFTSFPSHVRETAFAARLRKAINNANIDGPLASRAIQMVPSRGMASLPR